MLEGPGGSGNGFFREPPEGTGPGDELTSGQGDPSQISAWGIHVRQPSPSCNGADPSEGARSQGVHTVVLRGAVGHDLLSL